ncbi:MAG: amino acid permease, partial [Polaribacter sp.]
MLANFLNKSKPINFITLLILFFVLFLSSIYFAFFRDGFTGDKLLKSVILLFFFLFIFFIYNFILAKNKLTFDNSYGYFLLTLFIIPILPNLLDYKILIITSIYLLFIRKIYSLRSEKNVLEKLFDSGFWLGVLCIQEPLFIIFLLLISVAALLHKKINIHTLLVPIIGLITPLFLYFTYFLWVDKTEEFMNLFKLDLKFDVEVYAQTKYFWLTT